MDVVEKLLDQSVPGWKEDIDRHAIASGDHEDGDHEDDDDAWYWLTIMDIDRDAVAPGDHEDDDHNYDDDEW